MESEDFLLELFEKITYDISHDPIRMKVDSDEFVNIRTICGNCMKFFLNKMREFLDA